MSPLSTVHSIWWNTVASYLEQVGQSYVDVEALAVNLCDTNRYAEKDCGSVTKPRSRTLLGRRTTYIHGIQARVSIPDYRSEL